MASIDDFLAKANITKATPVENSIATAISKAKLGSSGYKMPDSAIINGWVSKFVPGIKEEYEKYFDALIAAAKAEYGENSVPVAEHVAQKAVWSNWHTSHATPLTVDLGKSGGKTFEDLKAPIDNVKKVLQEQTKNVTDATAAKLGSATQLAATNTSLYGKGTAEKPASKSIAAVYNDAQKNLTDAQANDTKKSTAKTQARIKQAQDKYNTAKENYDNAVKRQTSLSASNATRLSALDTTVLKSLDTYNKTAVTPFTNFLSGVPTPGPGETQVDVDTAKVGKLLEDYKKSNVMPTLTGADTALLGPLQKAVDAYETQKIADDKKAAAARVAAESAKSIAQTRGDITSYNALLAEARKKAPVVADTTTDLLSKMKGTTPPTGTPPPTGTVPTGTAPSNPPVELTDTAPSKLSLITDKDGNRLISDELIAAGIKGDSKSKQQAKSEQTKILNVWAKDILANGGYIDPFTGKQRSFTPKDYGYSSAFNSTIGRVLYGDSTPKLLSSYLNKIGRPTSLSGIQPATTQPATTQPATTQPVTTQPINAGLSSLAGTAPPKFTPPPQLGLKLSNDFNTRMIQQDLAAQQQLQNPGTYATGQFDPFFSGYLNSASQFSTQPSQANPDGSFSGGALYRPNTGIGFGFQNAYDASATTGKAAGGYLDAQSVGQSNQALQQQPQQQNNQLGLASIPNMSQYTNYTNNPGMMSPTQNTDDGGVGGISVLGQTNPMW
jgi:hypothetical protein